MNILPASIADAPSISQLFRQTIENVNSRHYSEQQVVVWSAAADDLRMWEQKIDEQHFFIAQLNNTIVGFASITDDGYIDYMYVHYRYQGRGIASALLKTLLSIAMQKGVGKVWAHVSLTARPFFASKGFAVTDIYITKTGGVEFEDCIMVLPFG